MKKIILTVSLFLIFCVNFLYAGYGTTSGLLVLKSVGARAEAMGDAYTTSSNDVFGFHYNPAECLDKKQAGAFYRKGIEGAGDSFSAVGVGFPFKDGNAAVNVMVYDAGSMELVDSSFKSLGTVSAEKDILQAFYLNKKFGNFVVGGAFKHLTSTLVNKFTADAMTYDLGVNMDFDGIRLGAAIQNIGGDLQYLYFKEKFPSLIRGGLSFYGGNKSASYVVSADAIKLKDVNTLKENLGFELGFFNKFFARLGYKLGYDVESLSMGGGIIVKKFHIDYAFVPYEDLGQMHKVSLVMEF